MHNANKGTALITGASSGIGPVYANRLAKQGYDLILVARGVEKLRTLAASIADASGRSVKSLQADLTKADERPPIEEVLRTDQSITMLVNSAGIGATASLLDSNADAMEAMIDLNVTALMRLAYAAAPAFAGRRNGTIVNIASAVAIIPEQLNGVYGGTKAFVLAFSQSLHHELADKGVRIQAVLPGATATDFWRTAGTPIGDLPREMVMSVDDLVDAALAGLAQGELVTIPSLPDAGDLERFEAAREALRPNLSLAMPARRYGMREPLAA